MQPRVYQSRAVESLRAARRSGARRLLLVAPTGAGKTFMACMMIATALSNGLRVLVIAHRKELIDQFASRLYFLGLHHGVMRGDDERTDPSAPIQLGTIQTLTRRELPAADLVFVDEAHRAPGESYRRVLEAYPQATVIGLTATPCRLDGEPLKEHFDVMVEAASYSELITEGAIVAPIVYAAERTVDLSKVKKVAGDYHEWQLEEAMTAPHVIGDVVQEWKEKSDGRATVVFAVGIRHSEELADEFRQHGARVRHLDGSTPEAERAATLLALELGQVDVVCNVGVLTEGWDQPRVKCCVMARPTLSLTLHMQTAGRILRPWGDRPPILLDHAGNVERHGLPHEDRTWSLDGKAVRKNPSAYRTCPKCYAYVAGFPCPLCGAVPAAPKPREVRKAPGHLRAVGGAPGAIQDPRRAFFDAQVNRARSRGFKPGYASAQYKEKFGEWPPWAWSCEAKSQLDAEWQARIEKRTREREYWQQQAERYTPHDAGYTEEPETSGIDEL